MRPSGASSFCGSYKAILQPHLDCGRGLRPLSFAAHATRAKGNENMKLRKLGGVGLVLLLGGCTTVVEKAPYKVTSFAEVPLKDKATVKIVSNTDAMKPIVNALKAEFAKSGNFKLGDENADYWFVLDGVGQYVQSEPQNKVKVVKQETANGVAEVLVRTPRNLASAATGVSVAVYEAKTLAPVHYFEIPIYTGENSETAVRPLKTYDAVFTRRVIERVKGAFLTQTKSVETPMPLDADPDLRALFKKGDYVGFVQKYNSFGAFDLVQFCEKVRTKKYEGGDAEKRLCNYYLYLLVSESTMLDPKKLAEIRDQQLLILETCDNKGLTKAVPVALARLEYKLANVGE